MVNYKTEQEEFWAGNFGDEYINRNKSDQLLASNLNFFSKALNQVGKFKSCIEFGANIGMNMKALKLLFPRVNCKGIEINSTAAEQLGEVIGKENVVKGSIFDYYVKEHVNYP